MTKNYEQEAARIAELCAGDMTNERQKAYQEFCALLQRAVNEGRVWTPERIRQLYPIAADLINEAEENERQFEEMEEVNRACEKLAEAIAIIEEHYAYLPAQMYNDFADSLTDLVTGAHLMEDPAWLREALPMILSNRVFAEERLIKCANTDEPR